MESLCLAASNIVDGRFKHDEWRRKGFPKIYSKYILLNELKPDFVLDIGTFHGGTALIWAMILDVVNPAGKVITVDIEDHTAAAAKVPLWTKRVQFLHGSSTDPKIVDQIRKQVAGKKVVAVLDSNHTMKHVLAELKLLLKSLRSRARTTPIPQRPLTFQTCWRRALWLANRGPTPSISHRC